MKTHRIFCRGLTALLIVAMILPFLPVSVTVAETKQSEKKVVRVGLKRTKRSPLKPA